MRVGFDLSPQLTGHSTRGIGSYTENLQNALSAAKTDQEIVFIDKNENIGNFDLIHHPYFDLFFHTLPIKKASKKRIVTIHDVIPLLFPDKFPSGIKGFINLFLQKQALKNVDFVICDSEASKQDVADKLSVPLSKIKVIFLSAGKQFKPKDKKLLKEITKKYNLPKHYCLYVGDVNWNKNISNLLQAIAICKTPIVMVGKALTDNSIPQVQTIDSQIKKLGLIEIVKKIGFVPSEDLVSIYNMATVTILPSYYEGFGLPVLESMACGTPVICSDNSSLSEISGSAAIFCNPSDPKDIADKISYVFSLKENVKKSLTEKSIKQAAKFNWQKTAQQTINLYKKVVKS